MKSSRNLIEELKLLPYVTKDSVRQIGARYGLGESTLATYISRALKRKDLISLRKGLYVASDFYHKHKHDSTYLFFLANILRKPSYVSSWTALQYYGLVTEAVRTITSVTSKVTRSYENKVGAFSYASIRKDLFTGSVFVKGDFDFFIATPAKALFDLLYAKTHQFRSVTPEQIPALLTELRVDIDEMEPEERARFYELVRNYTRHG